MELTLFEGKTELQQEAIELHLEIRKNGEIAAAALVEFSRGLKTMRDKHLYLQLGFETFEDYAEKAVGLKQRQAYNYIQVLESFGTVDLQSNAKFGITKLKILSEIPRFEREAFIEENNVEEMSTRELKDAVEELTKAQEQITFLTTENERLTKENAELEELEEDSVIMENEFENTKKYLEDKERELAELKEELKAARNRPIEVSVREPSAEEIAKLTEKEVKAERKKAEDKYKAELKKAKEEKEKAVAAAQAEANKKVADLEAKYKLAVSSAEKEKTAAADRLAQAEKNAKVSANPELIKFSFHFEEAQKNIAAMRAIFENADRETAKKLANAMAAVKEKLDVSLPEEDPDDESQERFAGV